MIAAALLLAAGWLLAGWLLVTGHLPLSLLSRRSSSASEIDTYSCIPKSITLISRASTGACIVESPRGVMFQVPANGSRIT